jgi:hypothetical protein
MFKKLLKITFVVSVFAALVPASHALAAAATPSAGWGSGCPWGQFKSMFTGTCLGDYKSWIVEVWRWAMAIIVPLSALMVTAAGVIYMTSGGNPQRVGLAKKIAIGVVSGIALLILARLLFNILGITSAWNVG